MFDEGDRAYYTTRDDANYDEGYGYILTDMGDLGGAQILEFASDYGEIFVAMEDELVLVPEFEVGDQVQHTYELDSDALYYGVIGTVVWVSFEDGDIEIIRADNCEVFGAQDYEFSLLWANDSDEEDDPVEFTSWERAEPFRLGDDPVDHPAHYTSHPSGIECIEITEHMSFNLGNAFKYIWRADLKSDAIEDLKKARFYLDREIDKREGEG